MRMYIYIIIYYIYLELYTPKGCIQYTYVHRFQPDPIKQLHIFSSKNVKKCKPKKQPGKKNKSTSKKKTKKMQKKTKKTKKKKQKKNKKQKQRQKEHIKRKTSNLNLYLVAKANAWPHANKYSNYQQQARRTWSKNPFLILTMIKSKSENIMSFKIAIASNGKNELFKARWSQN